MAFNKRNAAKDHVNAARACGVLFGLDLQLGIDETAHYPESTVVDRQRTGGLMPARRTPRRSMRPLC
jgi:hypothetical protein